jgi:TolA-binding protein
MDDELRELRERITEMSDAELLRMIGKDRREYRAEAIEFARQELDARQAAADSQDDQAGDDEADEQDNADDTDVPAIDRQPCDICGGAMRRGALFADREMTIYFDDTDEERFVEALVCSACGTVRLVVDLDTEVQE